MLNEQIFREYDIRGIVSNDLTDDVLNSLGKAFSTYFINNKRTKAIIGSDNRLSSDHLKEMISNSMIRSGLDVVDIGTVITPVFYFAGRFLNIDAGIMITASHNPPEYNGFKVLLSESTIYGEEIKSIFKIIKEGSFKNLGRSGNLEKKNLCETYISHLHSVINLGNRKIRLVLDCGNGTASLIAPEVFRGFELDIKELYCISDPTFPNHFPDPVKIENLKDLINEVKAGRYDIGIGLDGDGDRLGVVDEKGNIIWGDMLMVLFSREVLKKHPGSQILVEVKCSQLLIDEIKRLGGIPVIYKTGHSLIKAKMREIGAILAGEMSGHMFFKDEYFGFDDAVYAALRLIRILSNSNMTLSEMLSDLPKVYSTPEIRVPTTDSEKFEIVERAKNYLAKKYEINDIDGVRANINDGWGLIRSSNTAPEIIVRCEAKSEENLEFIKGELRKALDMDIKF